MTTPIGSNLAAAGQIILPASAPLLTPKQIVNYLGIEAGARHLGVNEETLPTFAISQQELVTVKREEYKAQEAAQNTFGRKFVRVAKEAFARVTLFVIGCLNAARSPFIVVAGFVCLAAAIAKGSVNCIVGRGVKFDAQGSYKSAKKCFNVAPKMFASFFVGVAGLFRDSNKTARANIALDTANPKLSIQAPNGLSSKVVTGPKDLITFGKKHIERRDNKQAAQKATLEWSKKHIDVVNGKEVSPVEKYYLAVKAKTAAAKLLADQAAAAKLLADQAAAAKLLAAAKPATNQAELNKAAKEAADTAALSKVKADKLVQLAEQTPLDPEAAKKAKEAQEAARLAKETADRLAQAAAQAAQDAAKLVAQLHAQTEAAKKAEAEQVAIANDLATQATVLEKAAKEAAPEVVNIKQQIKDVEKNLESEKEGLLWANPVRAKLNKDLKQLQTKLAELLK
jgi:chemotaxis protein histidine kinase CheA